MLSEHVCAKLVVSKLFAEFKTVPKIIACQIGNFDIVVVFGSVFVVVRTFSVSTFVETSCSKLGSISYSRIMMGVSLR